MHLRLLTADDATLLANFLKGHAYGSLEQSLEWGEMQSRIPGRSTFYALGVFNQNKTELIASMLIIRQKINCGKSWLWCPNGPVMPEGENAKQAWRLLKAEILRIANRHGDIFLRMEPCIARSLPLIAHAKGDSFSYLPRNTLIVDLSMDENDILKQMTQRGRYNIKQAYKAGVKVRKATLNDLPSFYKILKETSKRDAFSIHSESYYENFLSSLKSNSDLILTDIEGEVIGGAIITYFGNQARYYFGASSNMHRKAKAAYALQWWAMKEAKRRGCLSYDFFGIAPTADENHRLKGVTQFKTRFGGKRLEYHPAQVMVFRPFYRKLYVLAKHLH